MNLKGTRVRNHTNGLDRVIMDNIYLGQGHVCYQMYIPYINV